MIKCLIPNPNVIKCSYTRSLLPAPTLMGRTHTRTNNITTKITENKPSNNTSISAQYELRNTRFFYFII